jgi:hypothetical protein
MSTRRKRKHHQTEPSVLEITTDSTEEENGEHADDEIIPVSKIAPTTVLPPTPSASSTCTKSSAVSKPNETKNEESTENSFADRKEFNDDHSSDEDFIHRENDDNYHGDGSSRERGNHGLEPRSARNLNKEGKQVTKSSSRKVRTQQRRRKAQSRDSDDDTASTDSDQQNTPTTRLVDSTSSHVHTLANQRPTSATSRHSASVRKSRAIVDSSSSDSDMAPRAAPTSAAGLRTSPRRASSSVRATATTTPRQSTASRGAMRKKRSPRRRKGNSDDDEFVLESEDEASSAEEQNGEGLYDDDDDDDVDEIRQVGRSKTVGLVKEGDVGSADDESSNGDDDRPMFRSPQLQVRRHGRLGTSPFYDEDDSSEDDDQVSKRRTSSSAVCSRCPSTMDCVTEEELPEIHVCFFPPDGQHRQCFSLETMRQIALSATQPSFRTDNRTGSNTQTFLQPPHFRTPASPDLLDQIASRFGRNALDLHGEYYRRKQSERSPVRGREVATPVSTARNSFAELLERYISNKMGHQDLYCCPVCYIAAHKQLVDPTGNDAELDDVEDDGNGDAMQAKYSMDFVHDPMTILGYLDNDSFRIASTFCFTKITALKDHLRRDHTLDTRKIQGNDVYKRYMVRFWRFRYIQVDPSHVFELRFVRKTGYYRGI